MKTTYSESFIEQALVKPRFSIRIFQGVKTGLNVTGRSKDFDLSHTPSNH